MGIGQGASLNGFVPFSATDAWDRTSQKHCGWKLVVDVGFIGSAGLFPNLALDN